MVRSIENKDYISWSQLWLWEKSPEEYERVYIHKGQRYQNDSMLYGRRVADALENDETSEDVSVNFLLTFLPKYPVAEHKIKVESGGCVFYGKLDGFDPKKLRIGEYKTGLRYQGKAPWNKSKVDKADQLTFYAMLVWLKHKKLPNEIYLYWAETKRDQYNEIEATGHIEGFKTSRTVVEVLRMYNRAKKAYKAIQELKKKHGYKKEEVGFKAISNRVGDNKGGNQKRGFANNS